MAPRNPTTQEDAFRILQKMERYTRWIADQLRPFAGHRLLEVGAGTGNLTRFFLSCEEILAVDLDEGFLKELEGRIGATPRVKTAVMDVAAPADPLGERIFDTVLCVNVLEHVRDDEAALKRFRNHLAPGGKLLLLVPAHASLYGGVDAAAGHIRRYERRELAGKLVAAGFLVERLRHFNMLGALGWWVNVRVLRRRFLPRNQPGLLDFMVPLLRLEDRIDPPFGLSLIAIATKR